MEDSKKIYKQCADENLPGWQEMTKSDLCNLYISSEKSYEKEGAIAAIIYKCWNIFNHNFRDQPYIPLEDWYDSMIEAIMYVLDKHVWTNPKNILYGNPNAPEMALHRCIWSRKLNVYASNNKPKRIINKNIQSIEALNEKAGFDLCLDATYELNDEAYIFVWYIETLIKDDKIVISIILDLIIQGIPKTKLAKEIRNLNADYINYFVIKYNVTDKKNVENTLKELQNNNKLDQYLEYYITCLQRDENIIEFLKI